MSYETWKAQHYPVPANDPEALARPITHSLRKWEGLRKAVLDEHGLKMGSKEALPPRARQSLFDTGTGQTVLQIATESCALCVKHLCKPASSLQGSCAACPLYLTRGEPCDSQIRAHIGERVSPWASWTRHRYPEPMIELLKAALMKFPEGAS